MHRIGAIIPLDPDETETRANDELTRLTPEGARLQLAFQPVPVAADGTQLPIDADFVSRLGGQHELETIAAELARDGARAVGYNCTSASFVNGRRWAREQAQRIGDAARIPATNTSLSMVAALEAVGSERVGVATPYIDELNERLTAFLTDAGFDVRKLVGLGLEHNHSTTDTAAIADAARAAAVDDVDCVFIACTGQKVAAVLEDLESELGRPVLTANQVTLWRADALAGGSGLAGVGRLYRQGTLG